LVFPLYKFSCQRCLKCCKASNNFPTYQILFPFEVLTLSKYLLIYPLVFKGKSNQLILKWGFEIFSKCFQLEENKKICKIQEKKPLFCRLYPLKWDSNRYIFLLDKNCPSQNTLKKFKKFYLKKIFFKLEKFYKIFTKTLIEEKILDLHPKDIQGSYGVYLKKEVYKVFLKDNLKIFVENQLRLISKLDLQIRNLKFIKKYEKFLKTLK